MLVKEEIRAEALRLGFSACGFADANYDPLLHSRLTTWVANHYQADMKYMERGTRLRFDPKIHLLRAKSVIVCTLNYYSEPKYDKTKGYISLYGRGENYHDVIKDKLEALGQIIRKNIEDVKLISYVDSSPFAEKSWAAKAGLGFIGKNDLLIVFSGSDGKKRKSLGSFHFLGVIITDIEIEPDMPFKGTCGKCRRCIDACPTGAIIENRFIDANRCLAYHTLSNKGDIPNEITKDMGNNLFGCDACQLACPYNRDLPTTTEPRFAPSPELVDMNLEHLTNLTEADFRERFEKRSVGEKGYDIFKRNIAIVMANLESSK